VEASLHLISCQQTLSLHSSGRGSDVHYFFALGQLGFLCAVWNQSFTSHFGSILRSFLNQAGINLLHLAATQSKNNSKIIRKKEQVGTKMEQVDSSLIQK
jgi:hypothetical protein